MSKFRDLTNQVFGHLTPLYYEPRSKWVCRCACGQQITAFSQALNDGRVTSCGCQPMVEVKKVPRKSVLVAQQIVTLLMESPYLTSQQVAERLGLPYLSLVAVLNGLSIKGIVEAVTPSGRRQVNLWKAVVTVEEIPAFFEKVVRPLRQERGSHEIKDIGLTEEDEQWMQHYRTQWINRYRQMGQKPPISKFV